MQPLVRGRGGGVGDGLERAAPIYGPRDGSDGGKVVGMDGTSSVVAGQGPKGNTTLEAGKGGCPCVCQATCNVHYTLLEIQEELQQLQEKMDQMLSLVWLNKENGSGMLMALFFCGLGVSSLK